jgi:hypothetical protein
MKRTFSILKNKLINVSRLSRPLDTMDEVPLKGPILSQTITSPNMNSTPLGGGSANARFHLRPHFVPYEDISVVP